MKKIKYLQHPVSAELKEKTIAGGFKIVDARFDPSPKAKKATKVEKELVTEEVGE